MCDGWQFTPVWSDSFATGEGDHESVRLPHTNTEIPLHHADESAYELVSGYRRAIPVEKHWAGRRVLLTFDGAAHEATVYVNGTEAAVHRNGYTAFTVDLTAYAVDAAELRISVRLDSRESLNQPPFGHVVDYLTFGGLYREAWLEVREPTHVADVFVRTPSLTSALVDLEVAAPAGADRVLLRVTDGDAVLAQRELTDFAQSITLDVPDARPWSPESPQLYTLDTQLLAGDTVLDTVSTRFGFRVSEWRGDGFYLNGAPYLLRGLNRHQAYPYVGYAMPESLQRHDAEVLKQELQVNAVRTSHYPQSQHFMDACDELGLLVFTEIPGWQHIGDDDWKRIAVENVREMIVQYRNHVSIVLWGVRINESADDHDLYTETNALARVLDPSRQTSGVRFLWRSETLEDVYTFNDFSHIGTNRPHLPVGVIHPDRRKAYVLGEFNGAMLPIKSFDPPTAQLDHALRYATVLDAVERHPRIAGSFGWCMTDYYTHGDFGSGDRVGYYGVMDMFRNAKLAAAVYASAGEAAPVLAVSSSMLIGDYPESRLGDSYIFTNADSVRFYKDDVLIKEFTPGSRRWRHLAHPPILIDDTIGGALAEGEGFSTAKAEAMKSSILDVQRYAQSIPIWRVLRAAARLVRWGVSPRRAIRMYFRYIESWGSSALSYRFDAIRGGEVVASIERSSAPGLRLAATASHTALVEGASYDVAAVRLHVTDPHGNVAPYAQLPIELSVSGPAELIGPSTVVAEGGMAGTYLRSTGEAGAVVLTARTGQTQPLVLDFTVSAAR
jgi:beta-galactosidase